MKTYTENETLTTSKAVANNTTDIRSVPLKTPFLQTQLKIGKPNDEYEQEADRVADRVMNMPETSIQQQPIEEEEELLQPKLQMQEEEEEMMPKLQMQPIEEDEEKMLQTKPMLQLQPIEEEEEMLQPKWIQKQACDSCAERELPNGSAPYIQASPLKHIDSCGGQSLPDSSRKFFEPRFGRSFSNVKVHTCDSAIQMNQQLGAQAFTYGNNIFFNNDKYSPGSSDGKKLLAHELTHVVQQNGGLSSRIISPWIQRANTPDGVNLGPSDRSKSFCSKQTLWATTTTQNTPTRARGIQTITFKGKNTGTYDDSVNCSCNCGLYRHWIRGYWRNAAGGVKNYNVQSCGNALTINESTWTEEHTSCFGDNDTDACDWEYADHPGWRSGISDGTYVELHFEFKYQMWDSCNNRSIAQARRTLDISGDTHPRTITWSTP